MIIKSMKYIVSIFLSILSIYILSDKLILPYIFYVEETIVPNVINHNISTAKIILNRSDLQVKTQYIPSSTNDGMVGTIMNSIPSANKKVKKGTIIDIKVLGEKETYIVPDLTLKSKNIAINILKSMGIKIDTVLYDYWDILCTDPSVVDRDKDINQILNTCPKYKKNIIWKQFPNSGNKVFKDKSITLYVSRGEYAPELYIVPTLIDLSLESAIKQINKSGLLLGEIEYVISDLNIDSNRVIDQFPYGKCRITDKINLTVTK